MPILPSTSTIDFLQRQVLMSRNVRGGPLVDVATGGLNYQIDHHLFAHMPRPNLKRAQPLVRAHCREHVGLRARGPFECPLAADLRHGPAVARRG